MRAGSSNDLTIIKNTVLPEIMIKEILSNDSQITEFLDDYRNEFDSWFSSVLNCSIKSKDSWVNYIKFTKGMKNGYEWHNEKGVGGSASIMDGEYAGIIWVSGDEDCGGNLSVLVNDNIEEIKFKPNTAIIIPATMFHSVHHYYGTNSRISLNFTFDFI